MKPEIASSIAAQRDEVVGPPGGDDGAIAGEYALLLALLSVVLVTGVSLFSDAVARTFDAIVAVLP